MTFLNELPLSLQYYYLLNFLLFCHLKCFIFYSSRVLTHFFVSTALAKVFKFADVEETGFVDVATISTLAVQLLGAQLSENEKDIITSKAEGKAEKGDQKYFLEFVTKPFKTTVSVYRQVI